MWLVYAIAAAMVWGLDYSLGERIFRSKISPYTLLMLQTVFGCIIFFIVSYFTRLKADFAILSAERATLWWVVAAIITFNLGNLLIFLSIQTKNATLAGIVELCYPIFTIMFTMLLFKVNHLTPSVILGGALIFFGVFIIGHYN